MSRLKKLKTEYNPYLLRLLLKYSDHTQQHVEELDIVSPDTEKYIDLLCKHHATLQYLNLKKQGLAFLLRNFDHLQSALLAFDKLTRLRIEIDNGHHYDALISFYTTHIHPKHSQGYTPTSCLWDELAIHTSFQIENELDYLDKVKGLQNIRRIGLRTSSINEPQAVHIANALLKHMSESTPLSLSLLVTSDDYHLASLGFEQVMTASGGRHFSISVTHFEKVKETFSLYGDRVTRLALLDHMNGYTIDEIHDIFPHLQWLQLLECQVEDNDPPGPLNAESLSDLDEDDHDELKVVMADNGLVSLDPLQPLDTVTRLSIDYNLRMEDCCQYRLLQIPHALPHLHTLDLYLITDRCLHERFDFNTAHLDDEHSSGWISDDDPYADDEDLYRYTIRLPPVNIQHLNVIMPKEFPGHTIVVSTTGEHPQLWVADRDIHAFTLRKTDRDLDVVMQSMDKPILLITSTTVTQCRTQVEPAVRTDFPVHLPYL